MGDTALLKAVKKGFLECVNELTNAPGVDLNVKDKQGNSAVMAALKMDNQSIFQALVKTPGVDLTTRDCNNKSLEQIAR